MNSLVKTTKSVYGHQISQQMQNDYYSEVVAYLQKHGYQLQLGSLSVRLARKFGFCYGVERAVKLAYETRTRFPHRRIFLIGEIIHNPFVNQQLKDMGVKILPGLHQSRIEYTKLHPEDVVIIPAFGIEAQTLAKLQERGCILVDTTCGSVLNVWKRVEQYACDGFTAIIHGKYFHEETRATSSQVLKYPHGHYLVILNKAEAKVVYDYIVRDGDRAKFMKRFKNVASPGFDPDSHLQRIGLANQTTMLKSESLEIAQMLRDAMIRRYGEEHLDEHFRNFGTICSATQDRQDAVKELVQKEQVDLMLIIGGYNSSNTSHLVEIAAQYVPTYHIEEASALLSSQKIRHQPVGEKREVITANWLPEGNVVVGLSAGASTPNSKIGEVVVRLFQLRGQKLDMALVSE
ncbi:4-hydroxy-3-methylbut-2-enyl diphosphate reductase [candidate division KSB1 bacterium]|nr:MAG: 4-hydroxy-3-methylbut-2-enyl diphosphate reductase [candidate division KSB1 bacterium]RKY92681.1 MAG: 4-hydroxy-3-methylbut-2-enyl diphosphate reductase [candidate division KSB1 bacterium]HDI52448.1 4-hydroxy-3-methylbut-2-enyl diphosphate reductase [Bacteroidota bacterium]